jgi:hypothetical protein
MSHSIQPGNTVFKARSCSGTPIIDSSLSIAPQTTGALTRRPVSGGLPRDLPNSESSIKAENSTRAYVLCGLAYSPQNEKPSHSRGPISRSAAGGKAAVSQPSQSEGRSLGDKVDSIPGDEGRGSDGGSLTCLDAPCGRGARQEAFCLLACRSCAAPWMGADRARKAPERSPKPTVQDTLISAREIRPPCSAGMGRLQPIKVREVIAHVGNSRWRGLTQMVPGTGKPDNGYSAMSR